MPLKAVMFDLGLTLITTLSFPEIYQRILSRFNINASIKDIVRAQKETENEFDISNYDENKRKDFWAEYNSSLINKLDAKINTDYIAEQIDVLWWKFSQLEVYPDVRPTISELRKKGLKIGLISNGFQKDVDHVISELKLTEYFDVIVCIDSCNCAKPEKQIFIHALDKLEVEPTEAIYVGDSIVQDYEGALAVGIKPILIDREEKISGKYNKIKSLTNLLSMV